MNEQLSWQFIDIFIKSKIHIDVWKWLLHAAPECTWAQCHSLTFNAVNLFVSEEIYEKTFK